MIRQINGFADKVVALTMEAFTRVLPSSIDAKGVGGFFITLSLMVFGVVAVSLLFVMVSVVMLVSIPLVAASVAEGIYKSLKGGE